MASPSAAGSAAGQRADSGAPLRTVVAAVDGVLRWKDTGEEAAFFGVNYVAPFAYTYRALGYVKASPDETIRRDVLHLARMGLNAVRVHVWDREISDRDGNLVVNEHLRLLDCLIQQCREHGIYVLLTPITWYGNGYPEADRPLEGFSGRYPKREMGANHAAIASSARYLVQFVDHVNTVSGRAYKDDPAILGFELCNEPWSPPTEILRDYIETLSSAIRDTGCSKPLFYCASQSPSREHSAVLQASSVEGVTFGWYPSGLVSRRTVPGNFLPHVDEYPFMSDPAFTKKAKVVYEFDAADVDAPYLYPAFARTFRAYGVQWATQFAYCPLPLAGSNTPYPTHYLNLVYTPHKAVSMLIAAEAFRSLPRVRSYGRYPEDSHFGPFRVSFAGELSEMSTETAFLYSNDTDSHPIRSEALQRVVGCGSSPVARYEGTGCYFLEKQQSGVWRLELYPDAVWVNDPHGVNRMDREAVRLVRREWPMTLHLPDLGGAFSVKPLDANNTHRTRARNGAFPIRPGIYLLTRDGSDSGASGALIHQGQGVRRESGFDQSVSSLEFAVPESEDRPIVVIHEPVLAAVEGRPLRIAATVASSRRPASVSLLVRTARTGSITCIPMRRERGYRYAADVPPRMIRPGKLEYAIRVDDGGVERTFPTSAGPNLPGVASVAFGPPADAWEVSVSARNAAPVLFDAKRDYPNLLAAGAWGADAHIGSVPGKAADSQALSLEARRLGRLGPSARYILDSRWSSIREEFEHYDAVRIRARATQPDTPCFEVALLDRDGCAWGIAMPLTPDWNDVLIPLRSLRPMIVYRVPTAYPSPLMSLSPRRARQEDAFRIANLEAIQFSLRPELYGDNAKGPHGVEIESVTLARSR